MYAVKEQDRIQSQA